MGRQPCCDKVGLKRGPWTIEEDQKLINFILNNGIHCWRLVPKLAGLMRCGKSCRLRWTNYLRPDLKRGELSEAEEDQIIRLHSRLGNRWSKIASHFPGRTDNEIKNHWNTRIKKRLKLLGLDPVTHKPIQQPEKCYDSVSIPLEVDEEKSTVDITELDVGNHDHLPLKEEEETNGVELASNGNEVVLNGKGMVWESLDLEEMILPQANPSSSCNTSFSFDDTLNFSSVERDSSTLEGSKLCWADTIDSFPSWEALYYLEDVLSFGNYP